MKPDAQRAMGTVRRVNILFVYFLVLLLIHAARPAPAGSAEAEPGVEAAPEELISAPGGPPGLLAIRMLERPRPMVALGKAYLVYEFCVANYQTSPIQLVSIEAEGLDPRMGRRAPVHFKFDAQQLAAMIRLAGDRAGKDDPTVFAPGRAGIVMMWLAFDSVKAAPAALAHRISYRFVPGAGAPNKEMAVRTAPVRVDRAASLVIGQPLRGRGWIAGNAPSEKSPHRRAYMVAGGAVYFPERYAIDFVRIGGDGATFSGDPKKNASYHAYNAAVLAVADGVIAEVQDGIGENAPGAAITTPMTVKTLGGNYVLEEIGIGKYAFYAHLVPGSLAVKPGDRVKRGQTLARLGNSGNSTEPHLHFHIGSRPSPLAADGIPYAFDRFEVVPGAADMKGEEIRFKPAAGVPEQWRNSLVLDGTLMNFPEISGGTLTHLAD